MLFAAFVGNDRLSSSPKRGLPMGFPIPIRARGTLPGPSAVLADVFLVILVFNPSHVRLGQTTCKPGFVWREAFPGDVVWVLPALREQAHQAAPSHVLHETPHKPPPRPTSTPALTRDVSLAIFVVILTAVAILLPRWFRLRQQRRFLVGRDSGRAVEPRGQPTVISNVSESPDVGWHIQHEGEENKENIYRDSSQGGTERPSLLLEGEEGDARQVSGGAANPGQGQSPGGPKISFRFQRYDSNGNPQQPVQVEILLKPGSPPGISEGDHVKILSGKWRSEGTFRAVLIRNLTTGVLIKSGFVFLKYSWIIFVVAFIVAVWVSMVHREPVAGLIVMFASFFVFVFSNLIAGFIQAIRSL
jgi:hypothetical protein